jgi:hypothetical protein
MTTTPTLTTIRARFLAEVEHAIMAAQMLRQALLSELGESYLLQQSGILAASAANCRFFIQAASEISEMAIQSNPNEVQLPAFLRRART